MERCVEIPSLTIIELLLPSTERERERFLLDFCIETAERAGFIPTEHELTTMWGENDKGFYFRLVWRDNPALT